MTIGPNDPRYSPVMLPPRADAPKVAPMKPVKRKYPTIAEMVPPELRQPLAVANSMLNPVETIGGAMRASQRMLAPDTPGWDRVGAAGDMLSGVAGFVAPMVAAAKVGAPAANAVVDSFTGSNFVNSEAGNMRLPMQPTPAAQVAKLLSEGRASEVTDEMMAAVDPQEMWRLYESGATGMPMPMDSASRMARADEMGFNPVGTYHATHSDFTTVDPGAAESGMSMGTGERAFWTATEPKTVDGYLAGAFVEEGKHPGAPMGDGVARHYSPQASIMPLMNKLDNAVVWQMNGGGYPAGGLSAEISEAAGEGADAVLFRNMRDPGIMSLGSGSKTNHSIAAINPSSVRSRFARFDPRLKHLANLSAAGVGAAYLAPDERGIKMGQ